MNPPQLITTLWGEFRAFYSATGLCRLEFPHDPCAELEATDQTEPSPENRKTWEALTADALRLLLSGKAPQKLPPLDISAGTEFQQTIWRQLLAIPLGRTRTYGDLADELKLVNGGRAVGAACGANPIPVLIPCHRVLGAKGKLGGFSGGMPWKHRLLQIEGVLLA